MERHQHVIVVCSKFGNHLFEGVEETFGVLFGIGVEEAGLGVFGKTGWRKAVLVTDDDFDAFLAETSGRGEAIPTTGKSKNGTFHNFVTSNLGLSADPRLGIRGEGYKSITALTATSSWVAKNQLLQLAARIAIMGAIGCRLSAISWCHKWPRVLDNPKITLLAIRKAGGHAIPVTNEVLSRTEPKWTPLKNLSPSRKLVRFGEKRIPTRENLAPREKDGFD